MQLQPPPNLKHMSRDNKGTVALPRAVWWVTALFFAAHLTLCLLFDRTHPGALLMGDRSDLRLYRVQALFTSDSVSQFIDRVLSAGLPGDYLWHAALYSVCRVLPAPHVWMVMGQVTCWAVSILMLALLCLRLGLGHRVITLAVSLYALLPHSIAFPHMLLSENFFVPFVMAATYFSVCWLQEADRTKFMFLSAAMWAMSALTRPEALLAPVVVAAFLLLARRIRIGRVVRFLGMYAGILALWVIPSLLISGSANLSNQSPDQFHKLLQRKGTFLILTLASDAQAQEKKWIDAVPPEEYSLRDLMGLYSRHPGHAMIVNAYEEAKLLFRFDETKILTYLGIWFADADWQRELAGKPLSTFLAERWPIVLVVAGGSSLWFVLLIFAGYGIGRSWRRPEYLLIILLAIYALCSVLMTDNTQTRLRACVNYAFILFASVGYVAWRDGRQGSGNLNSTSRHEAS
jgi:hypothetical protein